jgi:quercetin dioxygenase-like cupin family protein
MKIFRAGDAPLRSADPSTFTGGARTARVAADETATPVHVYRVEFEPGGRTNWHVHSGPQWLFIVEGRVCAQTSASDTVELGAGDVVVFAPGEKHWHGAAPGSRGVHLAVNINLTTEWLEPVSDAEYLRPAAPRGPIEPVGPIGPIGPPTGQ